MVQWCFSVFRICGNRCRFSRVGVQCCKQQAEEYRKSLQERYEYAKNPFGCEPTMHCILLLVYSAVYAAGHKNVPTYFCQYLCQMLTDFKISSTVTLCEKFAIKQA